MVKRCIVCNTRCDVSCNRSFHKFPKNEILREKWLNALNLPNDLNFNTMCVCSIHFSENCFFYSDEQRSRARLCADAVPNILSSSCHTSLSEIISQNKERNSCTLTEIIENRSNSSNVRKDSGKLSSSCESDSNHINERCFTESSIPKTSEIGLCAGAVLNTHTSSSNISPSDDPNSCTQTQVIEESNSNSSTCELDSNPVNQRPSFDTVSSKKRKRTFRNTNAVKKIRCLDGPRTIFFTRESFSSDESWNDFVRVMINQRAKVNAAQQRVVRKRKKISSLQSVIRNLEENEEKNAAHFLKDLPPHVSELIHRIKNRKPTAPFPPNLKTFARTLHFHSPAAYDAVRGSFLNCLPSPKTLSKWSCSNEYEPGISEKMLRNISEIVEQELKKGRKLIFNVTFDEMHIRQHQEWDNKTHTWRGVVNVGSQLNELSENEVPKIATKALVFMIVNINGSFKAPIAYYFINALNGVEKSILLRDLLIKLHEFKITVCSVTFDGDKAHKTACESLGANLNYQDKQNFKCYFKHPCTSEPVFIFYDPCHCLKLCRNYLALKGPLFYNGNEINWSFIQKLNEKQKNEKLHLACKIKNRHVYFQNEKMKVFLAAQTLSRSSAIALNLLEYNLKDSSFNNSSYTAEYCKNMNDIFDLLNVRMKFSSTPTRLPITDESLIEIKKKIDDFIIYIENLQIDVTIKQNNKENYSCLKTQRKFAIYCNSVSTGFIGFIICLKNVYNLADYLLRKKYIDYLLSYKLSQDHLEMFFSLIRRMNGFNNNPNTVQFSSAFKKLLMNKLNVVVSSSANCVTLDNTLLIDDSLTRSHNFKENVINDKTNVTSRKKNDKIITSTSSNKISLTQINDLLKDNFNSLEHNYAKYQYWNCTEYANEILKYTAGCIVKIITRHIHCQECCKLLCGVENEEQSNLTALKNWGGLRFASYDVYFICKVTEKTIRQNDVIQTNIYQKLIMETLRSLPCTIFNNRHFLEQDPLLNHRNQIIMLIIRKYIDIRLKHESNILNDEKERIRIKNNKMTIFNGQ